MSSSHTAEVIKSRQLISNAGWNIFGRIAPVFVAIITTPKLIHMLGLSRWGVFTLVLSLIGTFGIFDLGLGRALTRTIATRPAGKTDPDTADLILTGVAVLTGIGFIAALVSFGCVDLWSRHALNIPPALQHEVRSSFFVFCATAPLVMINAALWGVLTGYQAFRATNLINIPISIMYYIGPVLMLYVWDSLVGVIFVLALCRLWMAVAYIRYVRKLVPELRSARLRPSLLKPLLQYGGWLTVSNIIYPLLGYMDRFIISSVVPVATLSYYTTSYDAVARLNMMTQAVNASSFSAFSSSYATDSDRTCELYKTSVVAVSSLLFPACLIGSLLSYQLLAIWIDPQFSAHSSTILKILCIGVFLSGVDSTTATFLEAIGRPDISTKISFGQLFLYLPLLYLFVTHLGVVGAAIAWSIRVFIDYTVRAAVCLRIYPMLRHTFFRGALSVIAGGSLLLLSMLPMSFAMTMGAAPLSLVLFYVVVWCAVLDTTERSQFLSFAAKIRRRIGGGEGKVVPQEPNSV